MVSRLVRFRRLQAYLQPSSPLYPWGHYFEKRGWPEIWVQLTLWASIIPLPCSFLLFYQYRTYSEMSLSTIHELAYCEEKVSQVLIQLCRFSFISHFSCEEYLGFRLGPDFLLILLESPQNLIHVSLFHSTDWLSFQLWPDFLFSENP